MQTNVAKFARIRSLHYINLDNCLLNPRVLKVEGKKWKPWKTSSLPSFPYFRRWFFLSFFSSYALLFLSGLLHFLCFTKWGFVACHHCWWGETTLHLLIYKWSRNDPDKLRPTHNLSLPSFPPVTYISETYRAYLFHVCKTFISKIG